MDDAIRAGMTVRDGAGKTLGKVRHVYPWGFEVGRRFWSPYTWVFRHDEIVAVDRDVVEVARRADDLFRLAAGELPETWRRYAPPMGGAPLPAAPAEARANESVLERSSSRDAEAAPDFGDLDRADEAEYTRTRGQPGADVTAHG